MQVIGEAADNTTIELRVGDALELRLPENSSTGYRWQVRDSAAPTCRIAEAARGAPGGAPPGQGGTHAWRIEAAQPGTGEIGLEYGRSWESAAARRFSLRVRVSP